ncbi:MAG: DNA topoisomerase IV subunit A, partial [Desulfobacteraceae bacterium]|nr:DNA topoisomerase IV subunit A [Desulfobacteraceae bacterium]
FISVLMAEPEQKVIVASTAGYGFISTVQEMYTRNTKGKTFLNLPEGAQPLPPVLLTSQVEEFQIVAITQQGRLLAFGIAALAQMPKGKGNKIIHVQSKNLKAGADSLSFIACLGSQQKLIIAAGKRTFTLTPEMLKEFCGERGARGSKLPRGFQNVSGVSIE